jgi:hypothetical protein
VLARLEAAEFLELNPHHRDDYRIAWICVLNAARGIAAPHVLASYAVLGLHPDRVWPAIVARRKAQLGPLHFEQFFGADAPPKKPSRSVQVVERDRAA